MGHCRWIAPGLGYPDEGTERVDFFTMTIRKQFQGSLETMPLSNILQWLADSKKTGTLVITIRDEEKRIILKDGIIVSASSNLEKERFGIIIIKKGFVTQEQVDGLLEEGRQTGKLLGKLCVEKGLIPEEDVKSILLEQSIAIVESLLHREEGQFVFLDETMDALDQIPLSIAMQELFFGSAGKRKEWQRIYELLGSLESIPKVRTIQPEGINNLTEFQQTLISRCNGKRRILDLLAEIDQKDFTICKALADLVDKKWIEIEDPKEELQREYQDRMWQVHISIEQKRYLRAQMLLDDITIMFPERLADIKPLQEKTRRYIQDDIENLLGDDRLVLYHRPGFDQKKVTGRTFGPQEWFLLSRIDGVTNLKDLIRMTGLPKDQSRKAIYALIDAAAVDIKGRKRDEEKESAPEKPAGTSRKPIRPKAEKKDTGDGVEEVSSGEEQPRKIEIAELDKIYRRYLKMNHYQILDVTRESSAEDVRNSFVKLSRLYHPDMYDRNNLDPEVEDRLEELFSMVNHAYRVISNLKARDRYDKELWVDGRSTSVRTTELENRVVQIEQIVLKPRKDKVRPAKPATKSGDPSPQTDYQQTSDMFQKVVVTKSPAAETGATEPKLSEEEKLLNESVDLFKANKLKDAIEKAESVLKTNPRNPQAYYYLSRSQQRMGGTHLNAALDNIKRALILEKENSTFYCQIGRVYTAMEMYDEAERYIKTALAWDSDDREAKYLLDKLREARQKGFFSRFRKKKK